MTSRSFVGFGGVQLGDGDDLGLGGEHGAELAQLAVQHGEVAGGVVGLTVDEMDVHAGALGVAEELVAQSDAAMRALHQAGNLHHHEVLAAVGYHPQHRFNGGKGVIGDFGLGGGAAGDKG